jgi:peptidoglycan/xylan/chitin deacetylase (PgdA/CDA1 family)
VAELGKQPGIELGAHTRTHLSLAGADAERQRAEIEGSRDDLAEWTGITPRAFAYPFGVPGVDFDDTTCTLVAEAGFAHATGNDPRTQGPFAVGRYAVPDLTGADFERWLGSRLG